MSAQSRPLSEIFRETVRYYFAPVTGAIRGIREEYRRLDAEYAEKYQAKEQHERQRS